MADNRQGDNWGAKVRLWMPIIVSVFLAGLIVYGLYVGLSALVLAPVKSGEGGIAALGIKLAFVAVVVLGLLVALLSVLRSD